jgi:hypothetical protein
MTSSTRRTWGGGGAGGRAGVRARPRGAAAGAAAARAWRRRAQRCRVLPAGRAGGPGGRRARGAALRWPRRASAAAAAVRGPALPWRRAALAPRCAALHCSGTALCCTGKHRPGAALRAPPSRRAAAAGGRRRPPRAPPARAPRSRRAPPAAGTATRWMLRARGRGARPNGPARRGCGPCNRTLCTEPRWNRRCATASWEPTSLALTASAGSAAARTTRGARRATTGACDGGRAGASAQCPRRRRVR